MHPASKFGIMTMFVNADRRGYTQMDIIKKIAEELKVLSWQVEAAVKLIDEGNTIPFISRYR